MTEHYTPQEARLYAALAATPGRVVSTAALQAAIGGRSPGVVRQHLYNLRGKLRFDGQIIKNEWGRGYWLVGVNEEPVFVLREVRSRAKVKPLCPAGHLLEPDPLGARCEICEWVAS